MNPKDKHANWLLKPTANELADGLAKMYIEKDVNGLFNKRIQNMLRQFGLAESIIKQQQLEIEALKKELETCKTIVALSNIAWERKHGKD